MLKNKTYQNWHQDIQKFKYYSTYSNDGESIPIKKTISPMASLMNSCKQPRKKNVIVWPLKYFNYREKEIITNSFYINLDPNTWQGHAERKIIRHSLSDKRRCKK